MRLVFAGTPDVAVPSLDALLAAGHEVALVVTRPDAPVGRKRVLTPSPVARRAEEAGLDVLRVARLDEAATSRIAATEPELGVVVAYGGLVRPPLLAVPRLGWINLHFSLLPRWRGAAPVQWSVIAGERTTGASVFQLEAGLDTGPVFDRLERSVGARETAGHLLGALAVDGAALVTRVVGGLADGTARSVPQSGEPTAAPKLDIADGRIDWTRPAAELDARIRGTTPEPGAWTELGDGRLKVLEAAPAHEGPAIAPGAVSVEGGRVLVGTGTGPLELVIVHPAGRTAMAAAAWARGLAAGTRLGPVDAA